MSTRGGGGGGGGKEGIKGGGVSCFSSLIDLHNTTNQSDQPVV